MIPYGRQSIDEDDIQAVVDVLRGDWLTQGPTVAVFERTVAEFVGARFAVAVSSATAGLHLAALVAGVRPGRALLTSPITFVASANAGAYAGGEVRFADVDAATINLCPDRAGDALSHGDIGAVVPVHFGGLPCAMPEIAAHAAAAGAVVIEDAAHALGATYPDGSRVGNCRHSLMTVFSCHPVKTIATGEGGVVTTNSEDVAERLRVLRSHGIRKDASRWMDPAAAETGGVPHPWYYEMQELGYHYRITDIQCALGISQMAKLGRFLQRRRLLVEKYDRAFTGLSVCRPAQPVDLSRGWSGHHIYPVRIDFPAVGRSRASVMAALAAQGVGTQVHYIPVPAQPYYRARGNDPDAFPAAQAYYREALTLPLFPGMTDADQDQVIAAVTSVLA